MECHHCRCKVHIAKASRSKGEPAKGKVLAERAGTEGRTKWVQADIDDILITGGSEEHLCNFEEVLKHHGFQLKADKCAFLQEFVEFLDHTIDKRRLHTSAEKVAAVNLAPTPKNQCQLYSFQGLVNYGKFIPNLATLLHPLNKLLKTGNMMELESSL